MKANILYYYMSILRLHVQVNCFRESVSF